MKKKIINGILMVALVGATSTSFVSCKDTSEDVSKDLMGQVIALKAELDPRLDAVEGRLDKLEPRMDKAETNIDYLKGRVNGMRDTLTTISNDLHAFHDSVYQVTQYLRSHMDDVEGRVDKIEEALTNLITSINVNATSTNLLQNSKLFPGINAQFLGAAYGQATTKFSFPSTEKDDYISGHGVVLTADDIKQLDGAIEDYKGYLPVKEEGAGTIYFTINPTNINAETLSKNAKLSLVQSNAEESFVKLGKVERAKDVILDWGLTRGEGDTLLWKAEATIDFDEAETLKKVIDPATQIDFVAIKEQLRSTLTNAYHAALDVNRNNYAQVTKTESKELIKDAAQIVATLLQTEFPSQPALALKADWTDLVGTRSVLSDYSIAATAYKPLSFSFGSELGIDGRTISLDKINTRIANIITKVRNKLAAAGAKAAACNFSLSGVNPNAKVYLVFTSNAANNAVDVAVPMTITNNITGLGYTAWTGAYTAAVGPVTYYTEVDLSGDIAALKAAIPETAINDMIAEVTKIIDSADNYAERAKNFEVRVSNFLEKYINKVILKISTDGLTRILEPIMLYQGSEGVNRLATGSTFKAGEYDLIPTTITYEVIAPVYKKYVAVIGKDGKVREAVIKTNGEKDFKKYTVKLQEGDQAIVYDALDFSGKQIAKKYAINVVK